MNRDERLATILPIQIIWWPTLRFQFFGLQLARVCDTSELGQATTTCMSTGILKSSRCVMCLLARIGCLDSLATAYSSRPTRPKRVK